MKTCKQIAYEWKLAERTINYMCKTGKITGAVKDGKSWQIPDDAARPADKRVTSGRYISKKALENNDGAVSGTAASGSALADAAASGTAVSGSAAADNARPRLPLPIGISDYVRASEEYYYVDKTMLIKHFLDRRPLVTLFTRPRRFGKTLNMDMLRVFFEISEEDTSRYFKDKAIWSCGSAYTAHQGKYPVISLSFKDVKFGSWKDTADKIGGLLQAEFGRHRELHESPFIQDYEKKYFHRILNGEASEVELSGALEKLSQMLTEHHGRAPVIIIDEYDTPIQVGYTFGFYNDIISFMRNLLSGAFKDNKYLSYGFLTGVLRAAQESIFSGLNNLNVDTVMDDEYASFFGFTGAEVRELLWYYGAEDKEAELKAWYNGYLFGHTEVYNPWSVINYIAKGFVPQAYWVNTGRNELLEEVLGNAAEDVAEKLFLLLQGRSVIAGIDQNVVYRSLPEEPAGIYSLLLVAGYLKALKKELLPDGRYLCEVSIPNKEVTAVYKTEVLSYLAGKGALSKNITDRAAEALYSCDIDGLQSVIGDYLQRTVSFYDAGTEGFYHGLMLGLIALMDDHYVISSNREAGGGRYDIAMTPRNRSLPGIIMEIKWKRGLKADALEKLASEGLDQINAMGYFMEMLSAGYTGVLKLGMAFSGKKLAIRAEKDNYYQGG
ncbi:MAG: AAA family ATPase [Eubacteriales bacterium]|nr:AAA family ATPase [Eubacteriales bacterium]